MRNYQKLNLNNLRLNDNITVFGKSSSFKSGYDGHPMKFLAITGNHVHVSVDTFRLGKYDYFTTYDTTTCDVARFPANVLKAIQEKIKK